MGEKTIVNNTNLVWTNQYYSVNRKKAVVDKLKTNVKRGKPGGYRGKIYIWSNWHHVWTKTELGSESRHEHCKNRRKSLNS